MARESIGAVVDERGSDPRRAARHRPATGRGGADPHRGQRRVPLRPVGDRERQLGYAVPDAARPRRSRHRGGGRPRRVVGGAGDRVVVSWAIPCGRCRRACSAARRCAHAWTSLQDSRRTREGAPLIGVLVLRHARHPHGGQRSPGDPMPEGIPLSRLPAGVRGVHGRGRRDPDGGGVAGRQRRGHRPRRHRSVGLQGEDRRRERLIAVDIAPKSWSGLGGSAPPTSSMPPPPMRSRRSAPSPTAGVDIAFEATGVPECVRQAVEMLAYAGTAVAIGVPPVPASSPCLERFRSRRISTQGELADHRWRGSDPRGRFPEMARWYLGRTGWTSTGWSRGGSGSTDLDEAFRAMLAGEVIRSVVLFD